jgi:Fur family ferric uptake transcriptional regulator
VEAGIIIRHQFDSKAKAEYELKGKAETHMHLVCSACGWTREVKINAHLRNSVQNLLKTRFVPEYFSLCAYGLCNKCKKEQKKQE